MNSAGSTPSKVASPTPFSLRVECTLNAVLSAIGALMGIGGTALLAVLPDQVFAVFVLYVISNIAWITAALRTRQPWLLLMNAVYLAIGVSALLRGTT